MKKEKNIMSLEQEDKKYTICYTMWTEYKDLTEKEFQRVKKHYHLIQNILVNEQGGEDETYWQSSDGKILVFKI